MLSMREPRIEYSKQSRKYLGRSYVTFSDGSRAKVSYPIGYSSSNISNAKVKIPNETTELTFQQTDSGTNVIICKDLDDLFQSLGM